MINCEACIHKEVCGYKLYAINLDNELKSIKESFPEFTIVTDTICQYEKVNVKNTDEI